MGVGCAPVTILSPTHGRLALLWHPPLFYFFPRRCGMPLPSVPEPCLCSCFLLSPLLCAPSCVTTRPKLEWDSSVLCPKRIVTNCPCGFRLSESSLRVRCATIAVVGSSQHWTALNLDPKRLSLVL